MRDVVPANAGTPAAELIGSARRLMFFATTQVCGYGPGSRSQVLAWPGRGEPAYEISPFIGFVAALSGKTVEASTLSLIPR